jgi:SAM-dependent methyltransferase
MLALEIALLFMQLALLAWVAVFIIKTIAGSHSRIADAPFIPTPPQALQKVFDALDIRSGDTVYELGSGDGRFLLFCAKRESAARYVGIEHNRFLVVLSRIKRFFAGATNVQFTRADLYETDFSKATKLYAYLLPSVMNRLLPGLQQDFTGRLASRAFRFTEKKEKRVVTLSLRPGLHGEHLLYVYDFE